MSGRNETFFFDFDRFDFQKILRWKSGKNLRKHPVLKIDICRRNVFAHYHFFCVHKIVNEWELAVESVKYKTAETGSVLFYFILIIQLWLKIEASFWRRESFEGLRWSRICSRYLHISSVDKDKQGMWRRGVQSKEGLVFHLEKRGEPPFSSYFFVHSGCDWGSIADILKRTNKAGRTGAAATALLRIQNQVSIIYTKEHHTKVYAQSRKGEGEGRGCCIPEGPGQADRGRVLMAVGTEGGPLWVSLKREKDADRIKLKPQWLLQIRHSRGMGIEWRAANTGGGGVQDSAGVSNSDLRPQSLLSSR